MPHPAKAKAKKSSTARHEAIQGYLFVTPYLIAFTIFTGIPFVSAFVLSFLDVKFITRLDDVHFVAFKNFIPSSPIRKRWPPSGAPACTP